MPKRLIMCCDGTWNTAEQSWPTNVTRIRDALKKDDAGTKQCAFYHEGVGVKPWERLRGGAFGFGLSGNVKHTYRFIVEHFEPGDELFFFGFSRGAFTARSTAGLIYNVGILRPEHAHRLDEAYALYRSRGAPPSSPEAQSFRNSYSHPDETRRIRFIGVWDTVGALGIPLSPARWANFINRRWQFHNCELNKAVEAAFQALAIDEKRAPFKPAVWVQKADTAGQRVEQVWFTGVHCDVGGGYERRAFADITLHWMVDRAQSCGLAFEASKLGANVLNLTAQHLKEQPHDSLTWFYKLLRPFVRQIGKIEALQQDDPTQSVASTAVDWHKSHSAYPQPNLVAYLDGHRQTQV